MTSCENCGREATPTTVGRWMQYRVGGPDSDDRFHLCPQCDADASVDPRAMLTVTAV